ncbi:MAG TPA: DUF4249 domain-containing protein [Chryseolinea sp.]|nr:DUF4249 domain-containing protein [Chryseolinea sp.]
MKWSIINILKSNMRSGFIVLGLASMMSSCLPDPLPVDGLPTLESKIVVSSQIIPDRGLVVLLTRSIGALDAGDDSDPEELLQQIMINDALVTLHYQNNIDTLTSLGNGLYGGVTIEWTAGITYELRAEAEGLQNISAFAQLKESVPFENVNARLFINEYDSLAEVNYSLRDPEGENFYMVNVQQFSSTQELTSLLNPNVFTYLKDDRDFEGQLFQDEFRVFFRDFMEGDTVAVFLSNVQKEYYEFWELRNENRYGFSELASEPLNYPTNVKGGLGFFTLQISDVRVFVLEE